MAYNVAATIASIPAGRAGDRWGPPRVLALGVILFGVAYLGFAAGSTSIVLLGLSFVAAGLGIGCVETAQHTAVATLAPPALRGSAFGLLASLQAFGNLAASAGAAILWTWGSPRLAFLYLAVWLLPALLGIVGLQGEPV